MNNHTQVTNPLIYSKRDLLLLLQLLHTNGLIDPSTITNCSNPKLLEQISHDWYNHKSTKLSLINGLEVEEPWEINDMVQLYKNLLDLYPGGNTTTMADAIYGERIKELETKLGTSQDQFYRLINESAV